MKKPITYSRRAITRLFEGLPGINLAESSGGLTYVLDLCREMFVYAGGKPSDRIDMGNVLGKLGRGYWDTKDEKEFWKILRKTFDTPMEFLPVLLTEIEQIKYSDEFLRPIIEWRLKLTGRDAV